MSDHPLSKALRDFRIFPIFEGSNDVMRAFVALNGLKALSDELPDVRDLKLSDPARALGVLAPYVSGKVNRALRPETLKGVHPSLAKQARSVAEQTVQLREHAEAALRKHGKKVQEKQLVQKRLAEAASGIYSQVAVIGRASAVLARDGLAESRDEKIVAINFLKRSQREVARQLRGLEVNDDRHQAQIGTAVRASNGYSFRL